MEDDRYSSLFHSKTIKGSKPNSQEPIKPEVTSLTLLDREEGELKVEGQTTIKIRLKKGIPSTYLQTHIALNNTTTDIA